MKRREFLATGGLATLGAAYTAHAQTAERPIRIGVVGCGRMGTFDLSVVAQLVGIEVTAVCDVDTKRAWRLSQKIVDEYDINGRPPKAPETFNSVEALLKNGNTDAIIVAVPDFQHGYCASACIAAGKDVYIEKPLAYTLEESQTLVKLTREKQVIAQIGSQQRSLRQFREAVNLIRAGRVGKLRKIRIGLPADTAGGRVEEMATPPSLDYDRWLGPLQKVYYTEDRCHPRFGLGRPGWMRWEPANLGMIANWGAHHIDIAQWAMNSPAPIKAYGKADFLQGGLWNVHGAFQVSLTYANGIEVAVDSDFLNGIQFIGDKGWIFVSRDNCRLKPNSPFAPRKVLRALDASSPELLAPLAPSEAAFPAVTCSHHEDWINAVRHRRDPIAPVEAGQEANTACILAWAALKTGQPVEWDPVARRIVNNPKAVELTTYRPREPYSIATLLKNL